MVTRAARYFISTPAIDAFQSAAVQTRIGTKERAICSMVNDVHPGMGDSLERALTHEGRCPKTFKLINEIARAILDHGKACADCDDKRGNRRAWNTYLALRDEFPASVG